MPRGISLHVGINDYSFSFPGAATLKGPERDAEDMAHIAEASGFTQRDVLLGADATYMRVTTKIRSAAAELEAGDIFFFSFAGHGFQQPDQANDGDEDEDFVDETMLLVDAQLLDDVLRKELWPLFKPGVRVLMIADSCHSGTVHLAPPPEGDDPPVSTGMGLVRTISHATSQRHRLEYREFYRNTLVPLSTTIEASILLLAACAPDGKTRDGEPNGVYTAALLKVLKESKVKDYDDLVNKITTELQAQGLNQIPQIHPAGPPSDFRKEKPFKI